MSRAVSMILVCHAVLAGFGPAVAAEPRYLAAWTDGSLITGDEIHNWQNQDAQPKLGDRLLFDPRNPAVWIRDTTLPAAEPTQAFVEFFCGDRLPGHVAGYQESATPEGEVSPAHVLIEPRTRLDLPGMPPRPAIRVLTAWIRRVIWVPRNNPQYQPGNVFLRNGRQVAYRAVHWQTAAVRLLLDEGVLEVPFSDIAELHLPARDTWEAHFSRLAILSPGGAGRLMEIETADDLKVTASTDRFQARSIGNGADPANWVQAVQPAWCLDALFLSHRRIRQRCYFSPDRMPLTWIEPSASRHRADFSAGWDRWQLDRSVQGSPLLSAGRAWGWGFGVHAHHELEFRLPKCVAGFRTRIGLDARAGNGGCVRGRIFAGADSGRPLMEQPLFESPAIAGSGQTIDSGPVRIPSAGSGATRLVLVADAAQNGRPVGTDPLDIRDVFDWLEPQLELEPRLLDREKGRHAITALAGLDGWTVEGDYGRTWRLVNLPLGGEREAPAFRLGLLPLGGPLPLSQVLRIEAGQDWLVILLSRSEQKASESRVEIRIDNRRIGIVPVPIARDSGLSPPIKVSVNEYQGRNLKLEVRLIPSDERSVIDWRGVKLATKPRP